MTPKKFNRALGAAIREQRLVRGLTMEAIAQQLGFTHQQQGKYEHGQNACTAHLAAKYATLFGISIAAFYELAGMQEYREPSATDNDAFLAARYVSRIPDEKQRSALIDYIRKLAYQGGEA